MLQVVVRGHGSAQVTQFARWPNCSLSGQHGLNVDGAEFLHCYTHGHTKEALVAGTLKLVKVLGKAASLWTNQH